MEHISWQEPWIICQRRGKVLWWGRDLWLYIFVGMGWGKKLGICIMVPFLFVLDLPEVGEKVGVDCWMELEYLQIILMLKTDKE